MSLYALPGLLFPPIESETSASSSSSSSSCDSNSIDNSKLTTSVSLAPELEESESSLELSESTSEIDLPQEPQQDSTELPETAEEKNDPVLYVKEARLDPELLVRYVTRCAAKVAKKQFCGSSRSKNRRSRGERRKHPYEDAIQFDLSITFNGRKYTATRTLPSFIQLRIDLIRERRKRKQKQQWYQQQEQQQCHEELGESRGHQPQEQQSSCNDGSYTDCRSSSAHVSSRAEAAEEDEILIPELPLPPLSDDESGSTPQGSANSGRAATASSVASSRTSDDRLGKTNGRDTSSATLASTMTNTSMAIMAGGFRMIHAVIKSYCPALERWLRHIVRLFPDSPTLTHFLWEPLGVNSLLTGVEMLLQPPPMPKRNSFGGMRKGSSGTLGSSLGSIQELDKECSSDEEEDCEAKAKPIKAIECKKDYALIA